jgi:hypothetical protein
MTFKRCAPFLLALCVAGGAGPPASAETVERPGWELSANTYPTNLVPPVDEVQEVTPNPKESTFTLKFEGHETAAIAFGATAAAVQSALEAIPSIGAGNVVVAEPAANVYTVTFVKTLGNMHVVTLEASGAVVSVKTEGAASGTVAIDVFNIGAGASSGTITVTDTLPAGVKAKEAGQLLNVQGGFGGFGALHPELGHGVWDCTGNGPGAPPSVAGASVVTCTNDPVGLPVFMGGGGQPTEGSDAGFANPQPEVGIAVEAGGEASGLTNKVSIAGGGASESAGTTDPVTISSAPAHGGLVTADTWLSNADGTVDRQAGSHPYTATFVFTVATALTAKGRELYFPGGEIRGLETRVPPGFVGDLSSTPQCRLTELITEHCPPTSIVGQLAVKNPLGTFEHRVFNMIPPPGEPAQLGFDILGINALIDFTVQTGSNYAIVAHVNNIAQRETYQSILMLWGVPQDESHNRWRGREGGCTQKEMEEPVLGNELDYCARQQKPIVQPFLTLPTACGEPQPFVFRQLGSWTEPQAKSEVNFLSHDASGTPAGFTGCEALGFEPSIAIAPDTAKADTPAGLMVEVKPPVGGLSEVNALGTADIQNTVVTLPEGLVVNPGQAAGLKACGSAEDGLTSEAEKAKGEENDGPPSCPNASKIGTVSIKSPLIEAAEDKQFEGNVYLLQSTPPELKLLVAASADGVNLKLVGTVHLNEQTGRLETRFEGTPELPFTVFKLSFSGGAQAALDTPTQCATYTTNADFTPWSSPFVPDFLTNASFAITEGPGGGSCPSNPLPFSPELIAGATTDQAGGFTSFSLLLRRGDGQQRIEKLQFKAPNGLAAMLSAVPLCPEPQAGTGACSSASQIGHASVASGPGPYPLAIPQPGEPESPIYITGGYKGAPFGLTVVTHVLAGPFDLGTIVTRAKIEVDPHTAQITVTFDPLPQVVAGVPTDLRLIDGVIDRPGFMFNPTNCNPSSFSGTAWGTPPPGAGGPGATTAISSHFQVGSCRQLEFAPKFSVSTSGQTSKAAGASLKVKVSYPKAPQGTQANIGSVKVELPKQLPSRLTTLQKACTEAAFNNNPATCPSESIVGHAKVITPILPVPLEGPAYFVSHGGAKFPELIMVLQGYGITIDLAGETFISPAGVTSSTFANVPDAPLSNFELTLPEGKYSALAANTNLCAQKLLMPTRFVGQNGATLTQNTHIEVEGCSDALSVASKKLKGRTVTLGVWVPAAGRLNAGGKGLSKAFKASGGREELRLTLHATRHGKFSTKIKLAFTPSSGKDRKKQGKTLTVRI